MAAEKSQSGDKQIAPHHWLPQALVAVSRRSRLAGGSGLRALNLFNECLGQDFWVLVVLP